MPWHRGSQGLILAHCFFLEPLNQPRGFPHTFGGGLSGEKQGYKHMSWDGAPAPAWDMQGHPEGQRDSVSH